MTKRNSNDSYADIYDLVNSPLKGSDITLAEVQLIASLVPPNGNILDIGVGTGRHAVPLDEIGFNVTGIDSSAGMIESLTHKNPRIKITNEDFLTSNNWHAQFDLIIMMWNTFNEIALTKQQALKLLRKSKQLLAPNGKILINIDDTSQMDPANLSFTIERIQGNQIYQLDWQVVKFNKRTNTTNSRETVQVIDEQGKMSRYNVSILTQRWWTEVDILQLCEVAKLGAVKHDLKGTSELYLILTPNE